MSDIPKDGTERADGWFNALSGHGDVNRSKSENSYFVVDLLDDDYVEQLWRGDDIAARIIEDLPSETFRPKFKITLEDKSQSEDVYARSEELHVTPTFIEAKEKERAYGGSAIYPVINDGNGNLAEPLNLERIPTIQHLMVLEPRELSPESWYTDIADPKFGKPEVYRLHPTGHAAQSSSLATERIHESRLIIFYGRRVSRAQASLRDGWGDSVMNRVHRVLRDYNISWASAAELLNDFSQAVFSIKGLAELIAQDKDEVIKARIRAVQLSRSTIRATMMDSEETFERKQTPVSGMPDLLDRFNIRLAAAADMPVTRLMGQSPAGLNATGDSDVRFYYDRISSDRERRTQSQLEQMVKLLLLEKDGPTRGKEPKIWNVSFNPLWQPSQKEETESRKTQADADVAYINAGVVSPEEVAVHRFGGDDYSYDLKVDIEEREALEAEMGEDQEGDAELIVEMGGEAETENVSATAMNGAQVSSLIDIVARVNAGELSRESAAAIIMTAFPTVNAAQAQALLGPKDFEPTEPEPAPNPFGGGKPPVEGEEPEVEEPIEEETDDE